MATITKPDYYSNISKLLETWMEYRSTERQNYSDSLSTIDKITKDANDITSIDALLNLIDKNNAKYGNKYKDVSMASEVVTNKLNNKKQLYEDYKFQMEKAKNMYLGAEGVKGFKDLTGDDAKYWTMDYVSSQLNEIDDFELSLYEDFEKTTPVKFRYSTGGVNDKQLIDRMKDYRGQLTAALDALRVRQ